MKRTRATTSDFRSRVSKVVSAIPKGKVATYGQVARLVGAPGAARAVGSCMRTNKDTSAVPCHRVVGSTDTLTGYAFGSGTTTKKAILQKEGVSFKGERVDLTVSGWQTK